MALAQGLAMIPAGHDAVRPGEEHLVLMLDGSSEDRPPFPGAPD